MGQSIKIKFYPRSGDNAAETGKILHTAYLDNGLSPQQSTENKFQPTTGDHSTKFTLQIPQKGTCYDSR
jgi:hypothetical protein